ncbi:hypothetical protein HMPREF2955_14665 [Prevotella sp. HMSC073D09]|nr:hypothetical protein HMPREF2955_14665 [Prevotella sp. HMSC073D09]
MAGKSRHLPTRIRHNGGTKPCISQTITTTFNPSLLLQHRTDFVFAHLIIKGLVVHVKRTGQARCPQANGRRTGNNGIDLKQEVSNRNNPKHVKSGITTDWVENKPQTIFRTAITSKGVCIDGAENEWQTCLPHSNH